MITPVFDKAGREILFYVGSRGHHADIGGTTHLPDVTVITPVFDKAGREILFYVGSRGHHAD
ncbi:hypothetical protein CTI14_72045, partial [Methylobacterium radiotolerans]